MFNTRERLKRRTPKEGIDREEYIGLLADEYYETTNSEAKEQVTANLANFGYDPINYPYFKKHSILQLFFELLSSYNERITLHGISGICNICLDHNFNEEIITQGLPLISKLLYNSNDQIVINSITTFLFLLIKAEPKTKQQICTKENIKQIKNIQSTAANNYVRQIARLFVTDYCDNEQLTTASPSTSRQTKL